MKTPMQELIEKIEQIKSKMPQTLISEKSFVVGINRCITEATLLLEKEKEVIESVYKEGYDCGSLEIYNESYYDETFNTKEK